MLPSSLIAPLKQHLLRVKALHERDVREGLAPVYLPDALNRKYPMVGKEWGWQYVFPAAKPSRDPISDVVRRHDVGPDP